MNDSVFDLVDRVHERAASISGYALQQPTATHDSHYLETSQVPHGISDYDQHEQERLFPVEYGHPGQGYELDAFGESLLYSLMLKHR